MSTILLILTGLVLFLYALNTLAAALKELSGEKLKGFLHHFTSNVVKGVLSGIIVTVLLDSSSVVIILVIAFVNARAITFRQALGIVMGANIGTTFSSQVFALNVSEYAAIPIAVGFGFMFFAKRHLLVNLGKVIFSFGLIFFGLFTMEEAVEPIKESSRFVSWLQSLESTPKGVLMGALVTVVVQSSSATMGMVIVLAGERLISLTAAIAVMLGAELGTCADTLVASVGRSRAAIRTGLFHLLFNVVTIVLAMLLLPHFTQLVLQVSRGASLSQTVANAHILFNTLGVLLMLPLVRVYESALNRLVPDRAPGTNVPLATGR